MSSLKDYFPHIIKLDEVSPYAGGIGQRAGLGTAAAAVTGFAKIKQPPQAREKGFPYRAYEEDETSAKDNEYVDDIDIALDFRNKINPFRIDMTVMSDPGHKYDNARSAQMKQQVRGGTHQNIEFEEEESDENLDETSIGAAYSGAKGRPAPGHRGAGTHVKPSSSGGRDRGGSSISRHIGPRGWSSAPLTEPEEEDYHVVDDEVDSPILKYIKKNIQLMIPELNVRGVHGPGGNAGAGRFGGHHGINTWARGITYQSDIIDKTKIDLQNTDIYKLIRWYEDNKREDEKNEEYDA